MMPENLNELKAGEKEVTVWKFSIPIQDEFSLEMPTGAEFLHVAIQDGTPKMWMMVDPTANKKFYKFRLVGTGHPIKLFRPFGGLSHLGTFMVLDGKLVYHLFAQ